MCMFKNQFWTPSKLATINRYTLAVTHLITSEMFISIISHLWYMIGTYQLIVFKYLQIMSLLEKKNK